MSPPPRLLVNPHSARGRAAARLRRLLRSVEFDVRITDSPAATTAEARRAVDDGLERVLVAGGDGTVHHAIQGLAGSECALGLVPTGTGNDLARALDLERDPERAGLRALEGDPRTIDVGRVDGRPFAGVVGIGIDGDVCRLLEHRLRWLRGSMAYGVALLGALAGFRAPRIEVDYDGGRYEGHVMLAALANSPCFGGGMRIAPQARLDDGFLELVVVERVSVPTLLRVFPRVYRGTHLDHPAVRALRVRSARMRTDPSRTFYADGEAMLPCARDGSVVDVWPRALRVIT